MRFKGVYWHKGNQAYTARAAIGKTYKTLIPQHKPLVR